ncbi:hypothetical protein EKG83_00805 [Saccharothrix syringae]|uniref:Uncharacterized protein n=1 Tax=Saccharothrix syringae TaxID=103733 RepID=A0A5Q0GQI7_SACSY|nr:hypothetical protein EKG83_00805 [Saccharothrix syringae]
MRGGVALVAHGDRQADDRVQRVLGAVEGRGDGQVRAVGRRERPRAQRLLGGLPGLLGRGLLGRAGLGRGFRRGLRRGLRLRRRARRRFGRGLGPRRGSRRRRLVRRRRGGGLGRRGGPGGLDHRGPGLLGVRDRAAHRDGRGQQARRGRAQDSSRAVRARDSTAGQVRPPTGSGQCPRREADVPRSRRRAGLM